MKILSHNCSSHATAKTEVKLNHQTTRIIRKSCLLSLLLIGSSMSVLADIKNSQCYDNSIVITPANSSEGIGCVFQPDPMKSTGNFSLTNMQTADYPGIEPAYRKVKLTHLNGKGILSGKYAVIVSEVGSGAKSNNNVFIYPRSDTRFDEVMAYYWVTEAQKYIQSLGFGSSRRGLINYPQKIKVNQLGVINAFTLAEPGWIKLGKGKSNPDTPPLGEAAEVIVHEYGHQVLFNSISFGDKSNDNLYGTNLDFQAFHEGLADYIGTTVISVVSPGPLFDVTCLGKWDFISLVPNGCIRNLANNFTYSDFASFGKSGHRAGQIISGPMWDIRQQIGNVKTDTVLFSALFNTVVFKNFTLPDFAKTYFNTAQQMYNANDPVGLTQGDLDIIHAVLTNRGLLQ